MGVRQRMLFDLTNTGKKLQDLHDWEIRPDHKLRDRGRLVEEVAFPVRCFSADGARILGTNGRVHDI